MKLHFDSICELKADAKWQKVFNERWPAYEAWLKNSGHLPDLDTALFALKNYMPEMVDTHDFLCNLVNADKLAASFLTGFQPPSYNSACSQVVSTKGILQLVRNYDYHPDRFEALMMMTAWNGKRIIANSDCLIGVLDGMNEDGLAVSLTFGGSEVVGHGFGIPFILRYVLEFCSNVEEAVAVLNRVPSHMAYNVTVTDKSGLVKTVQIIPEKSAVITDDVFATNHQGPIDLSENTGSNRTTERAILIQRLLDKGVNGGALINAFLSAPLHNTTFSDGLGTLYTAVYQPTEGIVQLHWLNDSLFQSFDSFSEERKHINFDIKHAHKDF